MSTHQISKLNSRNIRRTRQVTCPRDQVAVAESTRVTRPQHNLERKIGPEFTPIGEVHVPDSVKYSPTGNISYLYFNYFSGVYKAVDNKGINSKNSRQIDVCLAKYSKAVADELSTGGACYTGVKWAFVNAGILDDYGDMPKGSAHDAIPYFEEHKDKFEKVDVKKEDLSKLPAGMIIVYTKEGTDGHIAITNGNGQEMSDCTDNMKWLEAKGEGASFVVYKLTDNWTYNSETKKLSFNPPKK